MRYKYPLAAALILSLLLISPGLATDAAVDYIRFGDIDVVVGELQAILGVREADGNTAIFGGVTLSAVESFQAENGLPVTGEFDHDTLILLLEIPPDAESIGALVWIPMHGGSRYHVDAECSNMVDPREAPTPCAVALGFSPCKRCYK